MILSDESIAALSIFASIAILFGLAAAALNIAYRFLGSVFLLVLRKKVRSVAGKAKQVTNTMVMRASQLKVRFSIKEIDYSRYDSPAYLRNKGIFAPSVEGLAASYVGPRKVEFEDTTFILNPNETPADMLSALERRGVAITAR